MDKAELHKRISYVKSAARLVGYVFIPVNLYLAAIILCASELLGIAEESFGA